MQRTALQERLEQVIPEWCAANGFADDPVTVSAFKELAVKSLGVRPGGPSQDTRAPSPGPTLRLADECPVTDTVINDSATQGLPRPYPKGETFQTKSQRLSGTASADPIPETRPANITASRQSSGDNWMPNCSGDWRPLLHGGDWWVVGHYLMYPAGNKADAERLCQELAS